MSYQKDKAAADEAKYLLASVSINRILTFHAPTVYHNFQAAVAAARLLHREEKMHEVLVLKVVASVETEVTSKVSIYESEKCPENFVFCHAPTGTIDS